MVNVSRFGKELFTTGCRDQERKVSLQHCECMLDGEEEEGPQKLSKSTSLMSDYGLVAWPWLVCQAHDAGQHDA